eukprot:gb/GFBE01040220.1/.p1 GENE.gb/GFBE01040220.1/~~gb/GFBE01040220.1/.p1  ORF type:complete len:1500 (+),score=225.46 gb/GFBE01040220.1/:1-4500(+)
MGGALVLRRLCLLFLLASLCGIVEAAIQKPGNATRAETCAPYLLQHHSGLTKAHRAAVACAAGSHCVVPAGETWLLDSSVQFETLTIRGTLEWDTGKDNLELRAGHVLVETGGHLKIGMPDVPMERRATVYITKNSHQHDVLGKRFLGGVGTGKVDIHGRKLARTWTLLASNAFAGENQLQLKDDPSAMGWRMGDRIGVATTSRGESTNHKITSIRAKTVTLDTPLKYEHWGGFREIEGQRFEMAAEVVNLERSVVITGDHDDFEQTMEGLHTIMTGSGYMDMRYARVEWCGQRPVMGRYCLHFHLMRKCPRCVFQGNAVVEGQHVGITIHGTHQSLVDQNVVWDARANGVYTEDGNEMDNTISRNVVICTDYRKCKVDWVSGNSVQTAGIFLIGMSNNMIENRVVNYENGIWTPGSFRGNGRGRATNKVCPQFHPFGEWRGNVCHDNARFGLYLDNQFPRRLERDEDGYVVNRESCKWFTPDGRDNGFVNEIRDEFNWHNIYVGQYAMGDIQFINFTSVNNAHAMYWKQSKNFADGRLWHVLDSTFANDPNDKIGILQFLGPSGPFTFGMKNCKFLGTGPPGVATIAAGQNCGMGGAGGPCNVHYVLEGVDFSRVRSNQRLVRFGVHTSGSQAAVQSMFVAKDDSLGGYRSIVSGHLNGFKDAGCVQLGWEWEDALGCDRIVRRINVWGPDSGRIRLAGPGYQVAENWAAPSEGRNAGYMLYDSDHGGYGAGVLVGESFSLSGNFPSDMIVEFSDIDLGEYFGNSESINLEVGGRSCQLKSSDDRSFLCSLGRAGGGCDFRTFERQTVIRNGQLVCSDPTAPRPVAPVPAPSPTPLPALPEGSCADYGAWPSVDNGVTCGGCSALVLTEPYGGRCDAYCTSFGHVCAAAGEELAEGCQAIYTVACNQEVASTSDMLCSCRLPDVTTVTTTEVATTTVTTTTTRLIVTTTGPSATCSPFENWPKVDKNVTCQGCRALVLTGPFGGRCDLYCESFGHVCVAAAEEVDENCEVKFTVGCDEDIRGAGDTSDMLCSCRLPEVPSTTPTTTSSAPGSTSQNPGSTAGPTKAFWPVDGGSGRACRGASASDNSANYFRLFADVQSMDDCKAKCVDEPLCQGIEHHSSGRCEVWIRSEGIESSIALSGYTCLQYRAGGAQTTTTTRVSPTLFVPVNGGEGRACRGGSATDNSASYFQLFANVQSLDGCMSKCVEASLCKGIEYNPNGRCEVWTRPAGIQASVGLAGFSCLRYLGGETQGTTTTTTPVDPSDFEPVDGGSGRACRGGSATDNDASYFQLFTGLQSLGDCMKKCLEEPLCKGIEHNPNGRCEVWTRPEGIQASVAVLGFECFTYSGSSASPSTTSASTTMRRRTSTTTSTMTRRRTSTTTPSPTTSWEHYEETNCYPGFGGDALGSPPGVFTLAACQAQCEKSAACEGIVMRSGFADGTSPCWLVGNVDVEVCQWYPDYDFWHRLDRASHASSNAKSDNALAHKQRGGSGPPGRGRS